MSTNLKKVFMGVALVFASMWVSAIIITFLREGSVALHAAAFFSGLIGVVVGAFLAVTSYEEYEAEKWPRR